MNNEIAFAKTHTPLTTHVACMAAGMRDGLRTARYYARDLSRADASGSPLPRQVTLLSRAVAAVARGVDAGLSRGGDLSVKIVQPQWRALPSPFEQAVRRDVILSIQQQQFAFTTKFTAYFFRSAGLILERWAEGPNLVLEHRIEAARRALQGLLPDKDAPTEGRIAQVLQHLVQAAPVARTGAAKPHGEILKGTDANVAVMATACLALLLAEQGRPLSDLDEGAFLEISGALLKPRLPALTAALEGQNLEETARILRSVVALY
jgi:hypothetical protein